MKYLASPNPRLLACRSRRRRHRRAGLTLIELLIAVGLTLVIILAMIRAFKSSSESISQGRAQMDMHNKIRVVTDQLRRDLANATRPPGPSATSDGYFELIEGEETDAEHATSELSFIGDHDDILALTVRSEDEPFRGRFNGGWVESWVAEVVWWIVHDDTNNNGEAEYDESLRLYRRVLLIRPDLGTSETDFLTYYANNDVSVRRDFQNGGLVMNSLESLAPRQNRFAHNVGQFPHEMITDETDPASIFNRVLTGDSEGLDLMLDNCVAFDLKVFDPAAEIFRPDPSLIAAQPTVDIGQVLDFDDPGFPNMVSTFAPASWPGSYPQNGGYVNLAYDPNDTVIGLGHDRWFSDVPFFNGYGWNERTWCTWWEGYESDGFDQDLDGLIDEGQDGIDNDGDGIIDDNAERETRPPYAYPIRSLEVRVRMIEKKSNLILQNTVRESFVPN
jgi:type II secretory pathway component PulJ